GGSITAPEALVFVVEDEVALRTSLQDLLESMGLRVAACASAQECLRRPRPEGPSCLVLVDAAPFEAATWASTFGPGSGQPGARLRTRYRLGGAKNWAVFPRASFQPPSAFR